MSEVDEPSADPRLQQAQKPPVAVHQGRGTVPKQCNRALQHGGEMGGRGGERWARWGAAGNGLDNQRHRARQEMTVGIARAMILRLVE